MKIHFENFLYFNSTYIYIEREREREGGEGEFEPTTTEFRSDTLTD